MNDCSTDHSVDVIKEYMGRMPNLRLINRTVNSGAPMIPRNDAIEAAAGKYILFLDNDDFLGEEALQRLNDAAEKNDSDVIFGKYVGVNGRKVPQSQFKKGNRPNASIIDDNLVYTLAPHKMFNLSFIRENGFQFHPKAVVGEDQLFVMQCYINAKVITVLADYDYYYVVSRGNENLSLKYFAPEEFFFSFNRIMEFIHESGLNDLYKKELKVAFLNRFLHASRLRGMLLSNRLTRQQKIDWLAETKLFFDTHVDEGIEKKLEPRFHYFVQISRDNNLDKLLHIHKRIEKVTATDVTKIEDGLIYGRLKHVSKEIGYDEEIVVSHLNDSDVYIKNMDFGKKSFTLSGQFFQKLLLNVEVEYQLLLVHRSSGLELSNPVQIYNKSGEFEITIDYTRLLIDKKHTGPWDLFVEASVNGYKNRRRIGSNRSRKVKGINRSNKVGSFRLSYTVRPYFTEKFDNISLDVKLPSTVMNKMVEGLG